MVRPPMENEYLGTAIDFAAPVGEPALLAPDSVQWRVYKNPIALGIGGIAAVLLEFAEPRIRSGVWDHSTYKVDPIGRSRRTGLVAMLACYGPASRAKAVIDEVAYAYPIMNTGPVMDLERVEVLKGPQGTLYGRNTTAGLINFITAMPTDSFDGSIKADLGNYQTYNIGGFISGPLGEGIAARIAFRSENSDKGWQVSNTRNERLGEVE